VVHLVAVEIEVVSMLLNAVEQDNAESAMLGDIAGGEYSRLQVELEPDS